jgi:predicted AAA+ superfamily ATPase
MLANRYPSSSHLDGVVDLERLQSGKKTDLERDPSKFFGLTYPSDEIRLVIHGLTQRFSNRSWRSES